MTSREDVAVEDIETVKELVNTPGLRESVERTAVELAQAQTGDTRRISTEEAQANKSLLPYKSDPVVKLSKPIQRGSHEVKEVTIRPPFAAECKGLSLYSLAQMDVNQLSILLPRITTPALTKGEIEQMPLSDLFDFGSEVSGFLES